MLTEVKKHQKLMWLYFKLNLSAAMEYRVSFLTQVFGMMLNNAFFIFFWWVIYKRISSIGGYTFRDVMLIWALASSSFGFVHVIFGNVRGIARIIVNGELDTYLLQPKNVFINVLCSRTSVSSWGDFLYGYILIIGMEGFRPVRLLTFTGFVILGGLLTGSVLAIGETMAFFIGNASLISRQILEFIITFSIYPESIYRRAVRWVIYSILPAGFIVFVPARLMNAFNWKGMLLVLAVDTMYVCLAFYVFHRGLKRYESGNLITSRI